MREPNLPPGVVGSSRGWVTLTVDEIIWSSFHHHHQPSQVTVTAGWWGQADNDRATFSPVDIRNFSNGGAGDGLLVSYNVTTSENKFR